MGYDCLIGQRCKGFANTNIEDIDGFMGCGLGSTRGIIGLQGNTADGFALGGIAHSLVGAGGSRSYVPCGCKPLSLPEKLYPLVEDSV